MTREAEPTPVSKCNSFIPKVHSMWCALCEVIWQFALCFNNRNARRCPRGSFMSTKSPEDAQVFPKPYCCPPQAFSFLWTSAFRGPATLWSLWHRQWWAPWSLTKFPEPLRKGERCRPSKNWEWGAFFRWHDGWILGEGLRRPLQCAWDLARPPLPNAHSVFTFFCGQQWAAIKLHRISLGNHGVAGPHSAKFHTKLQLPHHQWAKHLQHWFSGCHRSQFEFSHGPSLTAVVECLMHKC